MHEVALVTTMPLESVLSKISEDELEDDPDTIEALEDKGKATKQSKSKRQRRKVNHRKIIVHENGEICSRTYNQPCPHDDDSDQEDDTTEGNFLSLINDHIMDKTPIFSLLFI